MKNSPKKRRMNMKKLTCVLLALVMVIGVMSVTAFAQDNISITVRTPIKNDLSKTITVSSDMTIAELKTKVADELSISLNNNNYWLYGNGTYYVKDTYDTKTLTECNIADGSTLILEKGKSSVWKPTADKPLEFYGLTIYGGVCANEPYGNCYGSNIDFYYSYTQKNIVIQTTTPIYISGTAEDDVLIVVNTYGWADVTFNNVTMSSNDDNIVSINWASKLNLTVNGTNTLTGSSDKEPVITINNSSSQLRITSDSTGSLNLTSTVSGVPALGTRKNDDRVYGIEIQGGNITANGGAGAPAIRTNYLKISGGSLTANPGTGCDTAIEVYESGSVSKVTEGLFQTTPSAGSITLDGSVSATEIRNTSKLTFSSYDYLPDGSVYRHDLTNGTVYVGETRYYWNSAEEKWVKCIHTEGDVVYTGVGEHKPTCESAGFGHTECTKCGEVISSNIAVPATGHNFIVIDAGNGYHMTICQNGCGIAVTNEHTYIDSKCTVCGNKENQAEVSDEEEIIEIDIPVESIVEESDTEPEEVPETGIVFGLSVLALCAAAVAVTKR